MPTKVIDWMCFVEIDTLQICFMEKQGENSGWRKRKLGGGELPGGDRTSGFETLKRGSCSVS